MTYGQGLVIITGPTTGLGPAYCKTLISAGFRKFLLIDEETKELESLKAVLKSYIEGKGLDKKSISLELFKFDFDDSYN